MNNGHRGFITCKRGRTALLFTSTRWDEEKQPLFHWEARSLRQGVQQTLSEYWLDLYLTDVISTVTSCASPSRGHSRLGSNMSAAWPEFLLSVQGGPQPFAIPELRAYLKSIQLNRKNTIFFLALNLTCLFFHSLWLKGSLALLSQNVIWFPLCPFMPKSWREKKISVFPATFAFS